MAVKESKGNFYGDKLVTPVGRMSYPSLFTKTVEKDDNGQPKEGKYELVLYIPKTQDVSRLRQGLEEVGKAFYRDKWRGLDKLDKCPIKDGDDREDPNAKGCWVVRANTSRKPGVVRADGSTIDPMDKDEVYGGCYGRASLIPASYDTPKNRGLKFYLENVQKTGDGERFGGAGGSDPRDDFGAFEEAVDKDGGAAFDDGHF
jgi:hypothetical protein